MQSLTIIIPAYNESNRISETLYALYRFISSSDFHFKLSAVIVVDDGSTDETLNILMGIKDKWPLLQIERLLKNSGKGAAVHRGLKVSLGDWVLIADADMSTPWNQLNSLEQYIGTANAIIGSRRACGSQITIKQNFARRLLGVSFNYLVRIFLPLQLKDTQCGFKLFKNDNFFREHILNNLNIVGYAWDIEILLWYSMWSQKIVEVPIEWKHHAGSKVRLYTDSLDMVRSLFRLRNLFIEKEKRL